MAGSYMDAPSSRLAYDRDGSIGVTISATGLVLGLGATDLAALNNESEDMPSGSGIRYAIIFPTPTDLTALFLALSTSVNVVIETSKNTTTGADGTWVVNVPSAQYLRDVRPGYRVASAITQFQAGASSQGVRGVRVSVASGTSAFTVRGIHLYGKPSPSAILDRLAFLMPTTDAEVPPSYFDWGNVPRASSADRTFRIKNLSPDLTAEGVYLSTESLTPGAPSVASMIMLSDDGGVSFRASLDLGDLAPGEISPVLTARRNIPDNAQVSVWSARFIADVTNWEN